MSRVPVTVTALPDGIAFATPSLSVPAEMLVAPEYVFAAERINGFAPVFVSDPVPLITPDSVKLVPSTWMVFAPVSVIVPGQFMAPFAASIVALFMEIGALFPVGWFKKSLVPR